MAEPEATFVHQPVSRHLQEIRLICVIPEAEGRIKCRIKHVDLQSRQTPDYRALSYTWGAPHPVQKILINDQLFLVRQNLYDFLEAFRTRLYRFRDCGDYGNEIQWLWIDQIYINQLVVEERNHQVEMMSDIYRRASYVYVWLGRSDKSIESVMKTIKSNFRRYYDHDPVSRRVGRHRAAGRGRSLISAIHDDVLTNKLSATALKQFFGNPYWIRLWIVQEIMLARYIRVLCGETLLSWEELRRFCSSGLKQLSPEATQAVPSQVIWLTQHALSDRQFTYPSLLRIFGTSGCENPRDKVYALQGIVDRENRSPVQYGSSVVKVFENTVMTMARTAFRDSQVQNGTDISKINYKDSMQQAFLDAAALWKKDLTGVMHFEMIESLIILRKEMNLHPFADPFALRRRLLGATRALLTHLAHLQLRMFLAKHQPQCIASEDLIFKEESSTGNFSRDHCEGAMKILKGMKELVVPNRELDWLPLDTQETPWGEWSSPYFTVPIIPWCDLDIHEAFEKVGLAWVEINSRYRTDSAT